MRILHLYFQLHFPHQLNLSGEHKSDLFQDAEFFVKANETEYQPFFALLERNCQKFPEFKVSLGVSGQWFEQAEKYDPALIQRLKKLINLGRVQLVAVPYDFSLAWFYDRAEFESQIEQFNRRIRDYFGVECAVLAMPELIYNDKIAKWAENAGYSGMLIGAAERILDWRTPNQVYEAKNCKDFRLICQNTRFSEYILDAKSEILELDKKSHAEVFAFPKFKKELGLEFLRGNLLNLCLDTSIFRRYRSQGVIKFLDDLIAEWCLNSQNRFYNALETIGSSRPKHEISIKTTIMRREYEKCKVGTYETGVVLSKNTRFCVPEALNSPDQVKFEENLYALREQVLKTKKEEVYRDFGRLTAIDYLYGIDGGVGIKADNIVKMPNFEELSEILTNFGQKVLSLMPKPAQITAKAGPARVEETLKTEENDKNDENDDFTVKVHRAKKSAKAESAVGPEMNRAELKMRQTGPETGWVETKVDQVEPKIDRTELEIDQAETGVDQTGLGIDQAESEILDRRATIDFDLETLPEAEVVDEVGIEQDMRKTKRGSKDSARRRTKHRRIVIE